MDGNACDRIVLCGDSRSERVWLAAVCVCASPLLQVIVPRAYTFGVDVTLGVIIQGHMGLTLESANCQRPPLPADDVKDERAPSARPHLDAF